MTDKTRKTIEIPEITRVEGHAAVHVDIENGSVCAVQLEVFEGTRFFEKLVVGHKFYEIPHITSRVCAICSTGHLLAASFAVERIAKFVQPQRLRLFRELMHLGMIIESHATHIFALAMPDFLGAHDLLHFATEHKPYFDGWNQLRKLGGMIQTAIGGRPFHPVNLQVGGLSHYPGADALTAMKPQIVAGKEPALMVAQFLVNLNPSVERRTTPSFLALIPDNKEYGYFGDRVRCTDGWEEPVQEYQGYLQEQVVPYSHAKRTTARGKNMMVGSLARLQMFSDRLGGDARRLYEASAMARGNTNTILNNLGQAIEMVQALDRCLAIIDELTSAGGQGEQSPPQTKMEAGGSGVGAVECPRGTLYHGYTIDEEGTITKADMVTPSVQNSGRIELDIREVVDARSDQLGEALQADLETLIRAYDPCNTCATHMVRIRYR